MAVLCEFTPEVLAVTEQQMSRRKEGKEKTAGNIITWNLNCMNINVNTGEKKLFGNLVVYWTTAILELIHSCS